MNNITLLRIISESLEYCHSFSIIEKGNNVELYFYYEEPIDRIKWVINKSYYKNHLKNIVDTTKFKLIKL